MTEYTWTGNVDPGDGTSKIWLRDRTLLFTLGSWADLTADEYTLLSQRRLLVLGRSGVAASNPSGGTTGALTDDELRANPVPINTGGATFREDFDLLTVDPNLWDVVVSGGASTDASAAGVVRLITGTTSGAKAQLTSKTPIKIPFRVQYLLQISQRIANQLFTCQVTNAAGDTVASWLFDGTTATSQKVEAKHDGVTGTATTVTATSNSSANNTIFEIDLKDDGVDFNERALEVITGTAITRANRSKTIPEPGEDYFIRVIAENTGTPATSTTLSLDQVLVQDSTRTIVDVAAGRGGTSVGRSIPVQVTNAPSVTSTAGVVTPVALTTGTGVTPFKHQSAASTNAAIVKASNGRVYGWTFTNLATTTRYVRLYNLATIPVVGTTVPFLIFAVPPNTQADFHPSVPIAFPAGIGIAVTAGSADLDATATAASDVIGTVFYI